MHINILPIVSNLINAILAALQQQPITSNSTWCGIVLLVILIPLMIYSSIQRKKREGR
jgi:hypothetical protein